jgi:hypothetical protein
VGLLSPPDLDGGPARRRPAVGEAARPGGEGTTGRAEEAGGWGQGRVGEHGGDTVVTGDGGVGRRHRRWEEVAVVVGGGGGRRRPGWRRGWAEGGAAGGRVRVGMGRG